MPSRLKHLMAEELKQRYSDCEELLVVGPTKLTAGDATALRRDLREKNIDMLVVKNSIARRVLKDLDMGGAADYVDGPSAFVTGDAEMPVICKTVTDAVKDFEDKLVVRGGYMNGAALSAEMVDRLAKIPPLPVLHAQIAGGIQAPITGVASAFQCLLRSIACALEGIREQKEGEGAPSAS